MGRRESAVDAFESLDRWQRQRQDVRVIWVGRSKETGGHMKTISYDYASLTKEKLIEHCEAYSASLHELADRCMIAEGRLKRIERNRHMFDDLAEVII
jgi:hypothetical protein